MNNYILSDINTNSSLSDRDRNAIMSLINKKIKPIINFLYYHNFSCEIEAFGTHNLIKDYEILTTESILFKILSRNDVLLNLEQSFLNFKREIVQLICDANSFHDLNNFVKSSEKLFYQFKVPFSKLLIPNKFISILFSNKLETNWMKSFEQFEITLNLISDFCDLNYSFEMKKEKVKQIIEVIGKNEDEGNVKDLAANLEKKNEESLLFVIKNALHLFS